MILRSSKASRATITREEIERAEKTEGYRLKLSELKVNLPESVNRKKGPRYTPVSRRHDRPNAVLWIIKNHPELKESQIMRLVGTTKPTIAQIRDRTHWNSQSLVPQDPVTLGLCSQVDLDAEVQKSARRLEREHKGAVKAGTLLPTEETTAVKPSTNTAEIMQPRENEERPETESEEAARVLAKLKQMKSTDSDTEPAETEE
jgi:uncharacterized protein